MRHGKNSLYKLTSGFMAFALAFFPSLTVMAAPALAGGTEKKEAPPSEIIKTVFEHMKTRDHVMGVLSTSGASIESLQEIESDLKKRIPDKTPIPKISFAKDQVLIGGKPTGIRVLSVEPLKLKYKGVIWKSDANATADVNYHSLVRFLEKPQRSFSWLNLFVPEAQASFGLFNFDTPMSGGLNGLGIGTIAGGFIGMATGWGAVAGAVVGGVLGGAAGLFFGWDRQQERRSYTGYGIR